MMAIIGMVIVILCVVGGYLGGGGHVHVLWQPFEFIIIFGAAIGAYLIGNPKSIISGTGAAFKVAFSGAPYNKDSYLELLCMMFALFKLAKMKGMLAIEAHIEKPEESDLLKKYPKFLHDHHAVEFFCDYMRMLTMGSENPHHMSDLMDEEIELHHHHRHLQAHALQTMADGMPALGIVAAVLGVIHTMGSINSPPAVLGHLIGGALVGTFMGILMSYGFIGPLASAAGGAFDAEGKYYQCMKAGIIAHMNGYAPAISVEFARKAIDAYVRPTFYEVEEALTKQSSEGG